MLSVVQPVAWGKSLSPSVDYGLDCGCSGFIPFLMSCVVLSLGWIQSICANCLSSQISFQLLYWTNFKKKRNDVSPLKESLLFWKICRPDLQKNPKQGFSKISIPTSFPAQKDMKTEKREIHFSYFSQPLHRKRVDQGELAVLCPQDTFLSSYRLDYYPLHHPTFPFPSLFKVLHL